jgi:hypothetical protein
VRATAASGQASDWSDPLKFIVVTRGTGSQVALADLSAELLGGSIYLIRGKAEPGITIRVAGRETIAAPDGAFQIQVTAGGTTRELTVEAQDPQGNSSQYKVSLSGRAGRVKT